MASNDPVYTSYSCPLCNEVDNNDMVQCDSCDFWFHFKCVNVTIDVASRKWSCRRCNSLASVTTKESSVSTLCTPKSVSKISSRGSLTAHQKSAALQKLDEEQSIKLDILNRKYQILDSFDAGVESESDEDKENYSKHYTQQWARKVQKVSKEFGKISMKDDISVSLSDHERDIINTLSVKELNANIMTSTAIGESQLAHKSRNVLRKPVLSSKLISDYQQSSRLYSDQSKIDSKIDCGSSWLPFAEPETENRYSESFNRHFGDISAQSNSKVESTPKDQQRKSDFNVTFLREPVQQRHSHNFELGPFDQRHESKVKFDFNPTRIQHVHESSKNSEFGYENLLNRTSNVDFDGNNFGNRQSSIIQRSSIPAMSSYDQSTSQKQQQNIDSGQRQQQKVKFDFGPENIQNVHQSTPNLRSGFENLVHHSPNVGCGFDRHNSGNCHTATNQQFSMPAASNNDQSSNQQPMFNSKSLSQSSLGCHNQVSNVVADHGSGYISNSSLTLTKNQIAARHVFKELPDFHGRPTEWLIFLSALKNSTTACGYTDGENLGRLQKSLKGNAKDLVYSRLLHADSVPGVIETLHLMYGRPNVIIHELLEKISDTPSPKNDDLNSLIKFAISVQNLSGTIEATGQLDYLRNPLLMQSLTDKLPTQIQLNWAYYKFGAGDANLSMFGQWLYKLAQVATDVVNPSSLKFNEKKVRKDDNHQKGSQSISYTNAQSENGSVKKSPSSSEEKCRVCDSTSFHKLENCKRFKQISTEDRWNLIKKFRICGGCFGNHHYFKCDSKKKCGKDGCTAKHHVLLHNSIKKIETSVPETKSVPHTSNSHRSVSPYAKFPDMFRIVPVKLSYAGKSVRIFVYLDDGSNLTSLAEKIAIKLGATGTKSSLCVLWSLGNSHQVESQSRQLSITISGIYDGAEEYSLDHVRTVQQLNLPTQSITRKWLDQYPHLENIPVTTYDNATPQMIIGLQYSKLMVSLETIEGEWLQPIACRTRLGWVVQGPNDKCISNESPKYGLNMCECQSSEDNHLHQLVREFFSIENFGVKITNLLVESKELSRANFLLETTIIKKQNRYESALLWRKDNITLPNSYGMALRRLECVESRMKKDLVLADKMCLYIADFVEKGYIRLLSKSEQRTIGPRTWYLPIFPVSNPKKPDKLRVVWDGAAKINGQSLNSNLLVGPDLLVPLPDILRRFRQRKIGITGDIKEMFHQILVRDSDQDSQRFLWRDGDANKEPDVYVMRVMTFGSSCSPSIAQFVKNKNAMEFVDSYPRAVEAITKSHYVDDMIDSTHTVAEAVQLIQDVQHIHQHAGFELRSFHSNSQDVLQALNGSDQRNKVLDDKINFTTERVLGLYWNTETDTFTYCLRFVKINQSNNHKPTKREILSAVMSIFDPLGFLAHFVVHAKILLQDIWRSKIGWDEALPISLRNQWKLWLERLPQVEKVHIPRLYSMRMSPVLPRSIQLHLFVDASLEAYAAVAYFRIENESGVDSCLVEAKTRVAPIKLMSVPRLELQGGVLGTRLAGSIIDSHHGLQINKTIIWCDSRTVLSWIKSDIRRYSQFVTFRVAEILDSPHNIEWRWIPSDENVPDDATKSKKNVDLSTTSRWFQGPQFLCDKDSDWNFELNEPDFKTDIELRPLYVLSHLEISVSEFIDCKRFSNWQRLVRTVSYVLRFINNIKSRDDQRKFGVFSSHELLLAESLLYKKVQYDAFQEELVIIRYNETVPISEQKDLPKNSFIRTCSAYLDENGVMRMKGRIDAASIADTAKRPIILDRHHYITQLIVYFYHRQYKHLNHQTVLNEIRQKFWIPKLRVVLGTIRNNCQKCKNTAAAPKIPEMAPLPDARLAVHMRPFTYTGIDYFGPIKVVFGRGTAKRWGVMITCLTTRAIHLEIAHSLDTSSCIMAIYNFIGRRGQPKAFYSDNGTNFHGANNTLREEFQKLDKNRIQEEFTSSEFSWSFNPPATPHMGGSWERMIQTVKNCLEASMVSRYPTDEVLKSLFIEAENIINSRPLTYVSLDTPNDEILTPNHFLIGSSNGYKPPGEFTDSDLLRNSWRTAQAMADKFWNAFVLEYLPTVTKRTKWFKKIEPLKIGDVVLIVDEKFKRNTWPKGLVVEVYEDKSGEILSARIRTDLGTFLTRSVSNLAVLDVHKNLVQQVDIDVKLRDSVNGKEDVVNES